LARRLESAKHYLWHGNSAMALERLDEIAGDLDIWGGEDDDEQHPRSARDAAARMDKYVRELTVYIAHNAASIVNYGERYRNGERISTAFTESTINQVVSKRMVKKQQMQWTPTGHTSCCKCGRRYSTRSGKRRSATGIRASGPCRCRS
jgi:hypothetical protein